jgi:hypothetical protein
MRRFKKLFEVEVLHNFYKNGYCKDIDIYPTQECLQYLTNNKMVFRLTNSGFKVLYAATDTAGTPLIELNDNTFRFVCKLKNPQRFYYMTKMEFDSSVLEAGNNVCFTNSNVTTEALTESIIHRVVSNEFIYDFPFQATDVLLDEASLEILDFDDTSIVIESYSGIKPDELGNYKQKLEFKGIELKRYVFRVSDTNNPSQDIIIQVDNNLARENIFGLIEINYEENSLEKYTAQLLRKESYWKYIIVNKNNLIDFSSEELELNDTSGSASSPYDIYTFTNTVQPDADVSIEGCETAVFTSDALIPCYEVPKLNLQLKRVSGPPDTIDIELKSHLPNPVVHGKVNEDNESEIYVFI